MKYVKFKYIYIQKYARYLWNINIADFAVLGEELLDVVDVGAVGEPVHFQADHPNKNVLILYPSYNIAII